VRGVATSGGEEVILSTKQLFVVALKKLVVARTDSAHRPACSGGMPDPASESRAERLLRRYKTFVRRNRALLTAIEQGAAGLTWLVPDGAHTEIIAEAASSFVGVVATLNDHLVGEEDEVRTVASEDQFEDALESVSDDDEEEETREDVLRSGGEAGGRFVNDSAKNSTHDLEEEEPVEAVPSASIDTASGDHDASLHDRLRLELRKLDRRASAFLEAVPVPLCLGILSQIEVLSEMVAKRRARRRGGQNYEEEALGPVVVLETARACLKTALWSRQGGKMLVDDGLSPDQLGDEDAMMDLLAAGGDARKTRDAHHGVSNLPPGERRAALALDALYQFRLRARAQRAARERAEAARRREEEGESGESPDVDDDGERALASPQPRLKTSGALGLPDVPGDVPGTDAIPPPPPPPPGLTLQDALREDRARLTLKLVGEACHIARPLLYAASMRRHGRKSWRPLLVSASLDATMFACLSAAGGADEARLSPGERIELRRRRASMAYYLMRSPVFDRVTAPALRGAGVLLRPVPLVGGLYGKAVAIAEDVNDHFAYTY
jgi:peroxin-16